MSEAITLSNDELHEILVQAVSATTEPPELMDWATRNGFARYSGNQWNQAWEWNKEKLRKASNVQLIFFFREIHGEPK